MQKLFKTLYILLIIGAVVLSGTLIGLVEENQSPVETSLTPSYTFETVSQTVSNVESQPQFKHYDDFLFKNVSVNNAEIKNGLLTIDTEDYSADEDNLIRIYKEKTGDYALSGTSLKIDKTAFAAFDKFLSEFCEATPKSGLIIEKAYSSSENKENADLATANALTLGIFNSKYKYTFDSPEMQWLPENAYKYGIILRYPENKEQITGYSSQTLYRYVGYNHAYYMNFYNLSLEEYVQEIKSAEVIEYIVGGDDYVLYYVPAASGSKTSVPVPANSGMEHTISGNGTDGFIVTVKISK